MFEPQTIPATSSRIEWGPAHLRDDAPTYEVELTERPDDN